MVAILAVAMVCGGVAGVCAFLIAFREYEHHFPDVRQTWRTALEFGLVAFLFFTGLGWLVCTALPPLLTPS